METGPRFKVSSERPEKRGIDLAIPGLVVKRVYHNTDAAPSSLRKNKVRQNGILPEEWDTSRRKFVLSHELSRVVKN